MRLNVNNPSMKGFPQITQKKEYYICGRCLICGKLFIILTIFGSAIEPFQPKSNANKTPAGLFPGINDVYWRLQ